MQEFTSTFVGAVTEQSARFWLRTIKPGPFTLMLSTGKEKHSRSATVTDRRSEDADWTMAFTIPDDVPAIGNLTPATEYGFRLTTAAGELIGEGQFETAPPAAAKSKFSFAFMSCHQPFMSDGSVDPDSARMLKILEPALTARGVKYVLLTGDQIYADSPNSISIFNGGASLKNETVNEIRGRYQAQYRLFWSFPEMQKLQSNFPTWCIWDDHEIINDWGVSKEHRKPEWRNLFEAAKRAFADYQISRTTCFKSNLPASFHQSFVWGQAATFIFDLCSERKFDADESQIFGDEQLSALAGFLEQQQNQSVIFIVLSVPVAYLPDWIVRIGERVPKYKNVFATRWNTTKNKRSLERLLEVIRKHQNANPKQRVVLLSGDVHQSAALKLNWATGEQALQFVSSAVTNAQRNWKQKLAHRLGFSMSKIRSGSRQINIERLKASGARQQNPFNGLNIGIVHIDNPDDGAKLRFEILSCADDSSDKEFVAFNSGWC